MEREEDSLTKFYKKLEEGMDEDLRYRLNKLKDVSVDYTNFKDFLTQRDMLESEFMRPIVIYLDEVEKEIEKLEKYEKEIKSSPGLYDEMLKDKKFQMYVSAKKVAMFYRDYILPAQFYMLMVDELVIKKLSRSLENVQSSVIKMQEKQIESDLVLKLSEKFDAWMEKEALRHEEFLSREVQRNEEVLKRMKEFYESIIDKTIQLTEKIKGKSDYKEQKKDELEEAKSAINTFVKKVQPVEEKIEDDDEREIEEVEEEEIEETEEEEIEESKKKEEKKVELVYDTPLYKQGIKKVSLAKFKYNFPSYVPDEERKKIIEYLENVYLPSRIPDKSKGLKRVVSLFSIFKIQRTLNLAMRYEDIKNLLKSLCEYIRLNKDEILSR